MPLSAKAGRLNGSAGTRARAVDRRRQRSPSIFNGEALPDFIYSLVERIKSGVKGSVVKIKYVPDDQKSENPVVRFHIDQHLFDPVTDGNNNVPQNVHRIPH
jgi:hypothetical protein